MRPHCYAPRVMPIDLASFEERFADYIEHLGDLDVAALTAVLTTRDAAPGDLVIEQGSFHNELLFLESGTLAVSVLNKSHEPHVVAELQPGAVVGEVGLLSPGPATTSVIAQAPARYHALSSQALDGLWSTSPAAASSLIQGLCHVMATRIRSVEGDLDKLDTQASGGLRGVLRRLFGRAA